MLLLFELFSWFFIIIFTSLCILPISFSIPQFPFLFVNILYIAAFLYIIRLIFFLKHTFLAKNQVAKVVVAFLCIPFVFYLAQELNHFQTYLDEEGEMALIGHLSKEKGASMLKYIYNEMLLFGMGSIISGAILPFRLVISYWRIHNNYHD